MKRRIMNLEINFSWLADRIIDFLKTYDFEMVMGELSNGNGFQIIAYGSRILRTRECIEITVEGTVSDFTVDFNFKERTDGLKSIFMLTMIGFGYSLLQKLKTEEALLKLEEEFWKYLDRILAQTPIL